MNRCHKGKSFSSLTVIVKAVQRRKNSHSLQKQPTKAVNPQCPRLGDKNRLEAPGELTEVTH